MSVYVSSINSQLSQGVDIPLVNQASFLNDMTLIFEQGYIIGDVSVNPNSWVSISLHKVFMKELKKAWLAFKMRLKYQGLFYKYLVSKSITYKTMKLIH